jgi:hypothetical protein
MDWSKLQNKKLHSFYFQLKMWRLKEGRYAGNVTQSRVEIQVTGTSCSHRWRDSDNVDRCTNFAKVWEQSQNSRRQKGYMKQVRC